MKKILNILLGVLLAITAILMVYAIATGGSDTAISINLMWCYALLVFTICAAIFCAVFGMIQNPAGIKGAILSLGLMIVIVGISYFISSGHSVEIPDLAKASVFGPGETILTETSILVTYVAMIAAFITAVATEVWGALK